jgi:uncharacterized membrane protein required for colicin V production
MYWLDTVILCVLAGGALVGFFMGFLWQMFWVISVSLGLYCTVTLNDPATKLVKNHLLPEASPAVACGAAYVLVFLVVFVLFLIVTVLLGQLIRKAHLGWLNRLLGSGFVGTILASAMGLVLVVLDSLPVSNTVVEQSKIAPVLVSGVKSMVANLPEDYRQSMKENVEQKVQEAASVPVLQKTKDTPLPLADKILHELKSNK